MSVRKGGQLIAGSVDPDKYANISLTNSPYTTNRILEIPQNIKLELNNGTLTLKAGSKVYVPNGFESDGTTPKFDEQIIQTDVVYDNATTNTATLLLLSTTPAIVLENVYSGSTAPTTSVASLYWYDTTNNIVKFYNGSSWDAGGHSLPIGIVHRTINVGYDSIDQIFNGFGYIGSTVFALPGVKYEYSIDVNPDGSYVNQIWTNPSVKLYTTSNTSSTYSNLTIVINPTTNIAGNPYVDAYGYHYTAYTPYKYPSAGTAYWFNPTTGKTVTISNSGVVGTTAYGILSFGIYRNAGKIDWIEDISINPVNTYSRSELSGLGMPSGRYIDLTLGASGSTYTAPANGWFCLLKIANDTQHITMLTKDGSFGVRSVASANTATIVCFCPVIKGDIMTLTYSAAGSTTSFKFYYAEGEN